MTALVLLALAAGPPSPYGAALPKGAVARLGWPRRLYGGPGAPAVSADGRVIAAALRDSLQAYDTTSPRPAWELKVPPRVGVASNIVLSHDGSRLANFGPRFSRGLASDLIVVYDVRKGKYQTFVPSYSPYIPPCFSRDGGRLAAVEAMGKATVWDLSTNKSVCSVEAREGGLSAVALSPDGKKLAACGATRGGGHGVHVWEVATGNPLATLKGEGPAPHKAVFSPDGRSLATLGAGSRLTLWGLAGKKAVRAELGAGDVVALLFAPDGKSLAVAWARGEVEFRDARSGRRTSEGKSPSGALLVGLGLRPDGRAVAAGRYGAHLLTWDAATGAPLSPPCGHIGPVQALAFRANGDLVSGAADGCRLWRAGAWQEVGGARWPLAGPREASGQRTCLSPDGKYAVWSGPSSAVVVDPLTGRRRGKLEGPPGRPRPLGQYAFSPDGRQLVELTASATRGKGRLRLWVLPGLRGERELEVRLDTAGAYSQLRAAFSPDGSALALTEDRPTLIRRPVRRPVPSRAGFGVVFDLPGGKRRADFSMSSGGALAWSPDGGLLAAESPTRGVNILNPANGELLGPLSPASKGGAAHLAFSPDGRLLAVAGRAPLGVEGEVTVYETAMGAPRLTLKGHEGGAQALAFSRDGRWLATGGADSTILVWDMTGKKWGGPGGKASWADLDGRDAAKAFQAMARLTGQPSEAVALLRKHLKPAPGKGADEAAVRRHLKGLAADDFETRQRSQEALIEAAARVAPVLEKARRETEDLEVRERLRVVLQKAAAWPRPAPARTVRAVEVLEWVGTPAARKFLRELAGGNADAFVTREAKAALKRLEKAP